MAHDGLSHVLGQSSQIVFCSPNRVLTCSVSSSVLARSPRRPIAISPRTGRAPVHAAPDNRKYQKVMDEAASTPEAAVRFLQAVGYEEFAAQCSRLQINLTMLTMMSMLDLERKLGIESKKVVVGLFDECLKLRRCLQRSSAAVEVPSWLPVVLKLPDDAVNFHGDGSYQMRPQSARGPPRVTPMPPGGGGGSFSGRRRARPLTASERTRFLVSGILAPGAGVPQLRERAREARLQAQQQLEEHRIGTEALAAQQAASAVDTEEDSPLAAHRAHEARQAAMKAREAAERSKETAMPSKRLPDPDAAAQAESAKAAIMRLVGEREAAIGALRSLMPVPRGVVARRRATRELIMAPGPLHEARADLAILLGEVRRTSAAICRAIYEWKLTLRARYNYFASLGDRQIAFYVGGVNYLTKMSTDLSFLPAPSAQDPLLLHWFGEQVPWLLAHSSSLAQACLPSEQVSAFQARSVDQGASPEAVAELAQAQKELLEEAARNGSLCSPADLNLLAQPPPPGGAGPDDAGHLDAGVRWQWAALQTLLYGGEAYAALLVAFPAWFHHNELSEAATVVQQQYRNRLNRKFSRVRRQATEKKAMMDKIAEAKNVWKSSAKLQCHWRGFLVRRALREATETQKSEDQRRRTAQELELAKLKQRQDERHVEEKAALFIQQRWKVKSARVAAKKRKATMEQRDASASTLLAQSTGVALLEKVLTRHRAANSVMWEIYGVVCLTYEVEQLEAMQDRLRETRFFASLQHRLTAVEAAQYEVEVKARDRMVKAAERELGGGASAKASAKAASAMSLFGGGGSGGGGGGASSSSQPVRRDSAGQLLHSTRKNTLLANAKSSSTPGKGDADAASPAPSASTSASAVKQQQQAAEERQRAGSKLGPDGLPRVDMIRLYTEALAAHKQAALEEVKLKAEVDTWRAQVKHATGNDGAFDEEKLRESKEARAQQALEAQRALRDFEAAANAHGTDDLRVIVECIGNRTELPQRLMVSLLEGAEAELDAAADWGVPLPQLAQQKTLWKEGQATLKNVLKQQWARQEDALRHGKECAKKEGSCAPLVEMCRLLDVVKARKAAIQFLNDEFSSDTVSFKMRERASQLHTANEPPIPPPPNNPNDAPAWRKWVADAGEIVTQFESDTLKFNVHRVGEVTAKHRALKESLKALEEALTEGESLANAWVQQEGRLRVLATLQAPERLRLNRILLGKRSDAYRKMCAEPVDTKLKFKAARRELTVVQEAESLADEIERSDVQHITYREAEVVMKVVDGREAPLEALIGDESAQEALGARLSSYLGELRENRIYVREAKRIEVSMDYSSGPVDEPATEVVLGLKREAAGSAERPSTLLMQALINAHEAGAISEICGVSRDNIKVFEPSLHEESIREAPTLVQLRAEAEELQRTSQERYDRSLEMKPMHKAQLRTWHRLKGALMHLRQLDATSLVEQAKAKKHGEAAADGGAIDKPTDGETPPQFLQRWMGVRDILRSKLAVLAAVSERDTRTRMRDQLVRCEGRLQLLKRLQEGCMTWPDVTITVQNTAVKADRRWNQGLSEPEYLMPDKSEPTTVDEQRKCGRFCYYCASLDPPVRVQHKMVDCPKRRKANAREYLPSTMAQCRAELAAQREACEGRLAEHRAATEAVRLQKQSLLELAGAIKVLGVQEAQKPPPPVPPPPPAGERIRSHGVFFRRRRHQKTMVMKTIARGSKIDGGERLSHVPGAWNELKAVALMMPHPRVLQGPLDPAWLFQVASTLELDVTPAGGDHHLLPFVIALARAPLPAHWYPLPPESVTAKDVALNPKWYAPAVGDDFVYPAKAVKRASTAPLPSTGLAETASGSASGSFSRANSFAGVASATDADADGAAADASAGAEAEAAASDWAAPSSSEFVLPPSPQMLDVYENMISHDRRYGHPGAHLVLPTVRGMQQRALRSLKPTMTDGWVQFADVATGEPFFYNFRKKERTERFPRLTRSDVPPCVLPMRQLEPSAKRLAAAGEALLPRDLDFADATAMARELLWEPRKAARAVDLSHDPCPLDELLHAAMYLGLNPGTNQAELMFLVDCMLSPELPVGWLVRNCQGENGAVADEYYWNALLGFAQWEHPQVSFLTGVADYLKALLKRETQAKAEKQAEAERRELEENAKREIAKTEAARRDKGSKAGGLDPRGAAKANETESERSRRMGADPRLRG